MGADRISVRTSRSSTRETGSIVVSGTRRTYELQSSTLPDTDGHGGDITRRDRTHALSLSPGVEKHVSFRPRGIGRPALMRIHPLGELVSVFRPAARVRALSISPVCSSRAEFYDSAKSNACPTYINRANS